MAAANSVPGISGGTIAFLMGFYDRFVSSLRDLLRGTRAERRDAIGFLFQLGIGWGIGLALCVILLANLFESHIYQISSLFIGLTLFSIPFIIHEEKRVLRGRYGYLVLTLLGMAAVFLLSYFRPALANQWSVNLTALSPALIGYTLLSGVLSMFAMVLPGISGSSLLLIMGLYMPVIRAVDALFLLDFSYFAFLSVFALGALLGIALAVGIIRRCLRKNRCETIYLILGLMIGSVYAIWMGPTTLDTPMAALSFSTFSPLFFLAGGGVMLGLEGLKRITAK